MSGERRVLHDVGGVLADIVDGLHDVSRQLTGLPYALVGGVAVLVHVQGHRVTEDIDGAVQALRNEVRDRLQIVADPDRARGGGALVVLPNGVPVDILTVGSRPPRVGIGALREAKAYGLQWAIQTAEVATIDVEPAGRRGPVSLPVATPAALVAMKAVSTADPGRGDKRATDLLDVWRLLSDNPVRTAEMLAQLLAAPDRLASWTRQRLQEWFADAPGEFVHDMAAGPGAPADIAEVRELWNGLIKSELG